MEQRRFGATGVQVSTLSLGTMNFGSWGNADQHDVTRIVHRALDAGITVIDTADIYSGGEAEKMIGQAVSGTRRDGVFLATKFHGPMGDGFNRQGNSRRWVMQAVDQSLRRLGTDWIDLYQVHRPDPATDFDETLGAMTDLVRRGKIRYIGTSTFPPSMIVRGQWIAERRHRERVVCEQPPYSILNRSVEREVLPVARSADMAVLTWAPLDGGWLSGRPLGANGSLKSHRVARRPERYDPTLPRNAAKVAAVKHLQALSHASGISLVRLAVGFVLEHPAVTSAVIGPRSLQQLEEYLSTAPLPADVLDRIDEIVPPATIVDPTQDPYHSPTAVERAARRRSACST